MMAVTVAVVEWGELVIEGFPYAKCSSKHFVYLAHLFFTASQFNRYFELSFFY